MNNLDQLKNKLTAKQKKFAELYVVNLNATESAILAGYSAKTAKSIGQENLTKLDIKEYIQALSKPGEDKRKADIDELLILLTQIARGEIQEEYIVIDTDSNGKNKARKEKRPCSIKDRLKAIELLGKSKMMFTDKVQIKQEMIVFSGEDELED